MADAENEGAEIPWEQIAGGAAALVAQTRLAEIAARFLVLVESWASPTAVACGYREVGAPESVRMVPELTSGTMTPAAERAFAKLFADYPQGSLGRATLIRPAEEPAGVKVRDTLVLPWSHGDSVSGFLVLRGLARPQPANLAAAVALLAQPLWPHLTRSADATDASAVEARLREVARLVGRIEADWRAARSGDQSELERRASAFVALQDQVAALEKAAATKTTPASSPADAEARQQAESERDAARAEAAGLRSKLETAQREADAVRARGQEVQTSLDTVGRARALAEAERDAARNEATELKAKLEAAQSEAAAARKQASEAEAASAAAETAVKVRAQAEAERDSARSEATDLRAKLEAAQRQAETERKETAEAKTAAAAAETAVKARAQAEAERDSARTEASGLRTKLEAAQRERNALLFEAAGPKGSAAAEDAIKARELAEAERNAARTEAASLRAMLATVQAETEAARSEAQQARTASEAAAQARAHAEGEHEALRGETAVLKAKLENLERDLSDARARSDTIQKQPSTEGGDKAAAGAPAAAERWEQLTQAFRGALEAIRRTPFVPPTVRVLCGEAEGLLEPKPATSARVARILLLDRDAPMLGALAHELETEGLEVLIAHHPDEVTLFLKTPDARGLTALVLDVLALRSDENLAELVRGWRRDLPGLPLFLTFRADNATEAERAQRIPSTSTAGYLQRPLQKTAVLDAVTNLVRRAARRVPTP